MQLLHSLNLTPYTAARLASIMHELHFVAQCKLCGKQNSLCRHVARCNWCAAAAANLQLSYLDLYLIHWPVVTGCVGPSLTPATAATWSALEGCVDAGLTRSIGVSNFSRVKLQQLLDSPGLQIRPAVLQVGCRMIQHVPLPSWLLVWTAAAVMAIEDSNNHT
jgi:diketogulonate reductase-like aldo/keto reductase